MFISLIIPVYNVEKYLKKCLESCVNQDLKICDYEILIINDGSPDNSLTIAENFASNNNNVRVISQSNKGLSEARNTGLKEAVGKYVWFVDSDDWIAENCLGRIVQKLEKEHLEALHLGSVVFYDDETKNIKRIPSFGLSCGIDVLGNLKIWHQAQLTIFKREFLLKHNLTFYPGIYHEDMEFIPRAYCFAEKCSSLPLVCYHYYQRPTGAITSEYKPKNIKDAIFVIERLTDFGRKQSLSNSGIKLWNNLLSVNINNLFRMASEVSLKHPEIVHRIIKAKRLYLPMLNAANLKYRVAGTIALLSPKLYLKIISQN